MFDWDDDVKDMYIDTEVRIVNGQRKTFYITVDDFLSNEPDYVNNFQPPRRPPFAAQVKPAALPDGDNASKEAQEET